MIFNPWHKIRHLENVRVSFAELPHGVSGYTHGNHIWINNQLQQSERRCAMAHEDVHRELGHTGCQTTAAEIVVRVEAARRLIELDDLLAAKRWAHHTSEQAEELQVTEEVLADRLYYLTVEERRQYESIGVDDPC